MNKLNAISAVVITYNEEEHIRECVTSLLEVADEVLVLDSFSTDHTKALCLSLGCTFIERKWEGYAATKNWANSQTNHPWILSIDADEVLSPELIESIQNVKKQGLHPGTKYSLNRRNNYCGQWLRYAGWYPDTKVRLFEKAHTTWQGDVHEHLVQSQPIGTVHLTGDLMHYSIKDKQDHINRVKKYCKLEKAYSHRLIAFLAAAVTFIKIYILKAGFLEGKLGFQLAQISAQAKLWRGR
jgi:glycosyltransferase involved in cell wall biosynthesis